MDDFFIITNTASAHIPAVQADNSVHAALWCQRQNQSAVLILHIYIEAAKARQEHHLRNNILQINVAIRQGCSQLFPLTFTH